VRLRRSPGADHDETEMSAITLRLKPLSGVMSMSDSQAPEAFAIYQGSANGFGPPVGKLAIGERGRIDLLEAADGFEPALRRVIAAVNSLDELRIKAPPPPDADPGALYRRTVTRDDADLTFAIGAFMEQKYDLRLVGV